MARELTVDDLFDTLHGVLLLHWLGDTAHGRRALDRERPGDERPNLVGHFNPVTPNRIQIVGPHEHAALHPAGQPPHPHYATGCDLILYADGLQPDAASLARANAEGVAVLASARASADLIAELRRYLEQQLAPTQTLHGVFISVLGAGVLITGDVGMGKSELALELISRGHHLIADDAPRFTRLGPSLIEGTCPPVLRDFLEVRGLGILNIQQMFGDAAVRRKMPLHLIVHLRQQALTDQSNRLDGQRRVRPVLGVEITEITLPVAPGRNLAVLVEAAARHYLLMSRGIYPAADLEERQRRAMDDRGAR